MINELKRRGGGYGVAAICGGLGQGTAAAVYVD
jgi:acetyl-CoA acetyltransferase